MVNVGKYTIHGCYGLGCFFCGWFFVFANVLSAVIIYSLRNEMTKKGTQHGLSLHQTVWSICSSTFVSGIARILVHSRKIMYSMYSFLGRGTFLTFFVCCCSVAMFFPPKESLIFSFWDVQKYQYPKNYGISKLVAWRSKNNPSEFHILTPCTPWKINGINCCKPENKRKIIWTKPSFPCRFELLIFLFFLSTDWLVHQVYIDTWMKFDYRSALPELVGGHGGYQLTWWLLRLFIYLRLGGGFRWICGPPAWNTLKK